jgi:ATP-dependent Clp protease ATP-binding subunit ClpC
VDIVVTDRTTTILALARDEVRRLRHDIVTPEHILLAIFREGEGVAAAVLHNLRADPTTLRQQLEALLPAGSIQRDIPSPIPDAPRTTALLAAARAEAAKLDHGLLGTEHLLMALTQPPAGAVADVLAGHGVHYANASEMIRRLLGMPPAG